MQTTKKNVRARTPLPVIILTAVALAACGQLSEQTARSMAELAKAPVINPSDDSAAPTAVTSEALAELNELAPSFTDDNVVSVRVHASLVRDAELGHLAVYVSTQEGVVTLKGFVESESARARAIEIARHVKGVKQVEDQLIVDQKLS